MGMKLREIVLSFGFLLVGAGLYLLWGIGAIVVYVGVVCIAAAVANT